MEKSIFISRHLLRNIFLHFSFFAFHHFIIIFITKFFFFACSNLPHVIFSSNNYFCFAIRSSTEKYTELKTIRFEVRPNVKRIKWWIKWKVCVCANAPCTFFIHKRSFILCKKKKIKIEKSILLYFAMIFSFLYKLQPVFNQMCAALNNSL